MESTFHPAFPQPVDQGAAIWRYLDESKFDWLLNYERLYMPSADKLGDPLEGSTPKGELNWWKREAEKAKNEEARRVIEHNRKFLSGTAQRFRTHYYVSCWHMNPYENHAMWGCYTHTSRAVAIQTTYLSLQGALPAYAFLGTVRYIDYGADRLPSMNLLEYVMHKDIYYDFEREVRAVVVPPVVEQLGLGDFKASHFESESESGIFVHAPEVELSKIVQGIVIHPDAPGEYVDKIKAVCAEKDLPIPKLSRRRQEAVY